MKRGQSTILDKGRTLRTAEPELVAGRNGSDGSTCRRIGDREKRIGETAGRALRNGARETREKTRKGMRGVGLGGPCHVARPDIGRGRDAFLRDPAWDGPKTCNGNIEPSLRVETDRRFGVSACRRPRETGRRFALRFRNRNRPRPRFFPVVVLWFG